MLTKKQKQQLKKLNKEMKGRKHSRFKQLEKSIETRVLQLADRGMSAYVISTQLKAEGVVLNRGKIQRLINEENNKRKNSNQSLLRVNKSLKAPFISNAFIYPQNSPDVPDQS